MITMEERIVELEDALKDMVNQFAYETFQGDILPQLKLWASSKSNDLHIVPDSSTIANKVGLTSSSKGLTSCQSDSRLLSNKEKNINNFKNVRFHPTTKVAGFPAHTGINITFKGNFSNDLPKGERDIMQSIYEKLRKRGGKINV